MRERVLTGVGWILLAVAVAAGAAGCKQPQLRVEGVVLRPPLLPGRPFELEARIVNHGFDGRQAGIAIWLRNADHPESYLQLRELALQPGEVAHLFVLVDAPPGRYRAEVEAFPGPI